MLRGCYKEEGRGSEKELKAELAQDDIHTQKV